VLELFYQIQVVCQLLPNRCPAKHQVNERGERLLWFLETLRGSAGMLIVRTLSWIEGLTCSRVVDVWSRGPRSSRNWFSLSRTRTLSLNGDCHTSTSLRIYQYWFLWAWVFHTAEIELLAFSHPLRDSNFHTGVHGRFYEETWSVNLIICYRESLLTGMAAAAVGIGVWWCLLSHARPVLYPQEDDSALSPPAPTISREATYL
jgi:hypothetical protein